MHSVYEIVIWLASWFVLARYLQQPTSPMERASCDYHFFNTYFYKKLKEAVMNKVSFFLSLSSWLLFLNLKTTSSLDPGTLLTLYLWIFYTPKPLTCYLSWKFSRNFSCRIYMNLENFNSGLLVNQNNMGTGCLFSANKGTLFHLV